ncbi:hypothetical protein IWW45_005680, partial [Coemansia sp. RSA 485]
MRHNNAAPLSSGWDDELQNADSMRGNNVEAAALGKRSRLQRATTINGPAKRGTGQVLITSSDSSDGVECVSAPTSSRSARVARAPLASTPAQTPIVLDEDDDDDDFVQNHSRRKSQRVSYSAMFCKNDSSTSSNSNSTRKSNTSDCNIDDSEEEIQIVLPDTRAKAKTIATAAAVTSRRVHNKQSKDIFMPSSPQLLHPSSPTIRRYNSQALQPIVLSESTQAPAFASAKGAMSSTSDTLEGSTYVCSNGSGRSNTAGSLGYHFNQASLALDLIKEMDLSATPTTNTAADTSIIPETPHMSPMHLPQMLSSPPALPELNPPLPLPLPNQNQQQFLQHARKRQPLEMPAEIRRYLQTDLPSDPISEFGTPANSSPVSRRLGFPIRSRPGPRLHVNDIIECYEDQHNSLDSGSGPLTEQPSITQWYHEGLSKCREEEEEEEEEEGSYAEHTQSGPLGLDDISQPFDGPEDECVSHGVDNSGNSQSILIDDDDDNGNEDKDSTEAGYSSPLEGFWDLRNTGDWSTQDRDMYINQFAPSKRQVAVRKRAQEKRDAVYSSLNNSSSDNGQQDIPVQFEPASETLRGRSRRGKGSKRGGTRTRAPRSGRGGAARSARGGRSAKSRKRSAIRPMSGSRTRIAVAQAPASSSSASGRRGAGSSAAAISYNHYANEPVLDIAAS